MLNLPRLPPDDIALALRLASDRHGVDLDLLTAVAWIETRFRPELRSPAGAMGLMQFMPATWDEYGNGRDPFDAVASADAGARYLRDLLGRYGGDHEAAAAAYNWGMGNFRRTGWPAPGWEGRLPQETRSYLEQLREILGPRTDGGSSGGDGAVVAVALLGIALALAAS